MSASLTVLGVGAGALTAQIVGTRRRVPRLPDAMGPHDGTVAGCGPVLRVEVIGESSVAGVGIERVEDSLTPALAQQLADRCGRTVSWRAHGWSGARVAWLRQRLLPRVSASTDLLVVVVGVNDVLRLTVPAAWEAGVRGVLSDVRQVHGPMPVAWVGLPKLGRYEVLPQPLRTLIGLRVAALEERTQRVIARTPGAWFVPTPHAPALVGADGFHPNEEGYRRWAMHVGDAICPRMRCDPRHRPGARATVRPDLESGGRGARGAHG